MAVIERGTIGDWVQLTAEIDRDSARRIGSSRSRLSTYRNGRVAPSATLVERMRQLADRAEGPPESC